MPESGFVPLSTRSMRVPRRHGFGPGCPRGPCVHPAPAGRTHSPQPRRYYICARMAFISSISFVWEVMTDFAMATASGFLPLETSVLAMLTAPSW